MPLRVVLLQANLAAAFAARPAPTAFLDISFVCPLDDDPEPEDDPDPEPTQGGQGGGVARVRVLHACRALLCCRSGYFRRMVRVSLLVVWVGVAAAAAAPWRGQALGKQSGAGQSRAEHLAGH